MLNNKRIKVFSKKSNLINIKNLIKEYYFFKPKINNFVYSVKFGTSGHRGTSTIGTFNEQHILAITQSIVEIRKSFGITGPCFVGKDTHALSIPSYMTVIEVLIGNGIDVITQIGNDYVPTPSISYNILEYNSKNETKSDGIILTSSHNPPQDGGIKYNFLNGGPAKEDLTNKIEDRANQIIFDKLLEVKRINYKNAVKDSHYYEEDFIDVYVRSLEEIIDMNLIQRSGLRLAVDPLGGAGINYWKKISDYYQINLKIISEKIDSTFSFVSLDYDGKIRMDCSSKFVLKRLLNVKNQFDLLFANDPDADRHGIVTPNSGLMESNSYLSLVIDYLFKSRLSWKKNLMVAKTLVSSSIIDRVALSLNKKLIETPVGFKWFVDGLYSGDIAFAGEESGGASFLRFNGKTWTTDKDGILLCLLSAEIVSKTGQSLEENYNDLISCVGKTFYSKKQIKLNDKQKMNFIKFYKNIKYIKNFANHEVISCCEITLGKRIVVEGVKLKTKSGWFAVRLSGTEGMYKIYCESYCDEIHLKLIEKESIKIVDKIINFKKNK